MTVKDRIQQYIDYKGISVYRLESSVGLSKGYWTKTKSISADVAMRISGIYTDISADWLLRGEGNMLKEQEGDLTLVGADRQDKSDTITRLANPVPTVAEKSFPSQEINLYDIDVSAGLSRLFAEDGEKNRAFLGKISIPNMPRCDGAVKVIGDSMYPLLKSGDIIAYKEVCDRRAIQWGEIYILQIEYDSDVAIVVKYVKRSEKGDDWIKLVSYNKEHDPKDIELANVKAIARVMVCIRQMSIM